MFDLHVHLLPQAESYVAIYYFFKHFSLPPRREFGPPVESDTTLNAVYSKVSFMMYRRKYSVLDSLEMKSEEAYGDAKSLEGKK